VCTVPPKRVQFMGGKSCFCQQTDLGHVFVVHIVPTNMYIRVVLKTTHHAHSQYIVAVFHCDGVVDLEFSVPWGGLVRGGRFTFGAVTI